MNNSLYRNIKEVLARLHDLVYIDIVNPDLPGGQKGEVEVADYLSLIHISEPTRPY